MDERAFQGGKDQSELGVSGAVRPPRCVPRTEVMQDTLRPGGVWAAPKGIDSQPPTLDLHPDLGC